MQIELYPSLTSLKIILPIFVPVVFANIWTKMQNLEC